MNPVNAIAFNSHKLGQRTKCHLVPSTISVIKLFEMIVGPGSLCIFT